MIVAVTGGKGGVGKSTVALNLGYELEAVVVDGDLATGDLPGSSGPTLHDVLARGISPLDAVERIGSVRYLPAGRTLAGARASDLTALEGVLERVEREYGTIVVDCPAGLARDVGTIVHAADLAVLVTTPEKTALVDALRTRDLISDLGTAIAAVVLNMADRDEKTQPTARLEKEFSAATTVLSECEAVSDAQDAWLPVAEYDPESPVVERFGDVSRVVTQCKRRLSGTGCI
ncbi:MinD/ParA family ATP-binding protein [Natrialbaceae archaeon A-gly3]